MTYRLKYSRFNKRKQIYRKLCSLIMIFSFLFMICAFLLSNINNPLENLNENSINNDRIKYFKKPLLSVEATNVCITEVYATTGSGTGGEWMEIYNPTDSTVETNCVTSKSLVGGWIDILNLQVDMIQNIGFDQDAGSIGVNTCKA